MDRPRPEAYRHHTQYVESQPYNMDVEQLDALRLEFSILSPEQNKAFAELEGQVARLFLEDYGAFLLEQQKEHMLAETVVLTDQEGMETFYETVGNNEVDQDTPEESVLNKNYYAGYRIKKAPDDRKIYSVGGMQFWAGRVSVLPLNYQLKDFSELSVDSLIDSEDRKEVLAKINDIENDTYEKLSPLAGIAKFQERVRILRGLENELKKMDAVRYPTRQLGSLSLHEKIHGIQLPTVPLPILEVAAYYYEEHVFSSREMVHRSEGSDNGFSQMWEEVIEEVGEDAHRYVFGTLPEDRIDEVKKKVFAFFTEEKMAEKMPNVVWEKEEVA